MAVKHKSDYRLGFVKSPPTNVLFPNVGVMVLLLHARLCPSCFYLSGRRKGFIASD
jgi:hypothetical protein